MDKRMRLALAFLMMMSVTLACRIGSRSSEGETDTPEEMQGTNTPDYSGPCANVLYPFIPGRQWIYQKMGTGQDGTTPDPLTSKFGLSVEEVSGSQATLKTLDMGTGATTLTTAECEDGAITNFPAMIVDSLFGSYLAGGLQSEYVSGMIAPSKAELDASGWNMEWESEYVTSGTITFTSEGEDTSITLDDSPINMTWKNAGQETVTVVAGTYEEAYKVTCTTQVQATLTIEGITGAGTLTFRTVHWFAPYIGLLKTEIDSASLTILGFTFPLEAGGSVELVEVH